MSKGFKLGEVEGQSVWDTILSAFPAGTPQFAKGGKRFNFEVRPGLGEGPPFSKDQILEHTRMLDEMGERWEKDELFEISPHSMNGLSDPYFHEWSLVPSSPIDLFAVAGVLLQRSGAYNFVESQMFVGQTKGPDGKLPTMEAVSPLTISDQELYTWQKIGREWRLSGKIGKGSKSKLKYGPQYPPPLVEYLWALLIEDGEAPITVPENDPELPRWWLSALALFIIADEACEGVGHSGHKMDGEGTWCQRMVDRHIKGEVRKIAGGVGMSMLDEATSYTLSNADPDEVCVLPKSRTSQVGCTLRCFSRHLALLPPKGSTRINWVYSQLAKETAQKGRPLNVLLVPYPYSVSAQRFKPIGQKSKRLKPKQRDGSKIRRSLRKPFGFFELDLPEADADVDPDSHERDFKDISKFIAFLDDLIKEAKKDSGEVDVIVFPELALSSRIYERLVAWLAKSHREIELFVSGLNSIPVEGQAEVAVGNFAAITVFSDAEKEGDPRNWSTFYHRKHHRWCLNKDQIKTYSLGAALEPSRLWWERHPILTRRLTVLSFRQRATAAVLICEDLARSEPAQELLRAIGPKIIFALLMDGPQLKTRWPARYATVLADDPGSSVLTLTSLALINRTNSTGEYPQSRCIGLWRDPLGATQQLELAPGHQAMIITLSEVETCDQTLDGRESYEATTWSLSGITPLKICADKVPTWMV